MLESLTAEAGTRDGLGVTFCVLEVPVRENCFKGVPDNQHSPAIEMIHMSSAPGNVIILQTRGHHLIRILLHDSHDT